MQIKSVLLSIVVLSLAGGLFASDRYTVDEAHSTVGFSVRHLGISNVKGTFPKISGTLILNEKDISKSSVNIIIDAGSIDTNNEKRDEHLRGKDFFEVDQFPTVTFKSERVSKTAEGYLVTGNLTMKGVTKTVAIPFSLSGPMAHPMAPLFVVGAGGTFTLNRREYKIEYGPAALISDDVAIDLQVEFTRPNPQKK